MKTIDEIRNQISYEELPNWRKFLHGWIVTFRSVGIKAVYKYPYNYYKLWKKLRK